MNVVILTAAGVGSRMGQDIPKQFMHVNDKPVIIYTMEAFQQNPLIDAILVATLPSWIEVVRAYAKQFNITKLKWIIGGGNTGPATIHNGISILSNELSDDDLILVHDGDRCNVSQEIISNNIAVAKHNGSAVTVIPCFEAVFKRKDYNDANDTVTEPRHDLWRIQTPYTYSMKDLKSAYDKYDELNLEYSAPCLMMEHLHRPIYFSKGSSENLKITTVEDLNIFKALINTKKYEWTK